MDPEVWLALSISEDWWWEELRGEAEGIGAEDRGPNTC